MQPAVLPHLLLEGRMVLYTYQVRPIQVSFFLSFFLSFFACVATYFGHVVEQNDFGNVQSEINQ
jgi:hypothetical protein